MMQVIAVLLSALAIFSLLGMGFCVYMLIRNDRVLAFRKEILDRSEFVNGKLYPYAYLPSYDTMLYRFWVMDFEKFIRYPKGDAQ